MLAVRLIGRGYSGRGDGYDHVPEPGLLATCVAEDFKLFVMRTVKFMHNTKGAQRM